MEILELVFQRYDEINFDAKAKLAESRQLKKLADLVKVSFEYARAMLEAIVQDEDAVSATATSPRGPTRVKTAVLAAGAGTDADGEDAGPASFETALRNQARSW